MEHGTASTSEGPSGSVVRDYAATIDRLERRATGSRKRVRWVGGILACGVTAIALGIFFRVSTPAPAPSFADFFRNSPVNTEALMAARVRAVLTKIYGPLIVTDSFIKSSEANKLIAEPTLSPEERARLAAELKGALDDLERTAKIEAQRRPDPLSTKLESVTYTFIFSLGAVGFLILLIQIAVMFIKYHVRLAELYEAQADALRASGGDAQLAYGFLQHFSPNSIELGSSPTTLYEKALDTIKEVAHKK